MNQTLRTVAATVILLAAPAVILICWGVYADSVPDPVATHWNLSGEVDGTSSVATFSILVGVITALLTAFSVGAHLIRGGRPGGRDAALIGGWVAWFFAGLYAVTMRMSDGASSASEVELAWGWIAVVLVVSCAVTAVLWALLPQPEPRVAGVPPASSLTLSDDERIVWVGQARSKVLLAIAAVAAIAGAVQAIWFSLAGLTAIGMALLLCLMHYLTVRVDRDAVTVRWGPLRFLRHRLPLDSIVAARAEEIQPLHWGGWGYRVSTRGRAAVVRRGPAMVLSLRSGSEFAVTVEHPEEAVELVNALLAARQPANEGH